MSIEDSTYHDRAVAITSSRVHFGLTVCGDVVSNPILGPNLYGGGGASVDAFHTVVRAERTDLPGVEILYEPMHRDLPPEFYLSARAQQTAAEVIERIQEPLPGKDNVDERGIRLTILDSAPEHVGLGSKTSLAMAIAYAAGNLLLADTNPDGTAKLISHNLARSFSGRGGTSRIGVLACEFGGVVFEDGHKVRDGEAPVYMPSSRRVPLDEPVLSKHVILPDEFRIALFLDSDTPRMEGQEEVKAFQESMPFSYLEVLEAIAVESKIMKPAFDRLDMLALSNAFRFFSDLVLKRKEVQRQTDKARSWLSNCWDKNYPVGVSSWGPVMFAIGRRDSVEMNDAHDLAQSTGLLALGEYAFNNSGVEVTLRRADEDILADMIRAYAAATVAEQVFQDRARERY